ncbi:NB-ARC-domain-containing protein [Mycena chlorophos]|uniref:NB-ARC-domain-containing protein n=1 Tax=Mycena chlorophos TaxID=658473 RepID=A0A8H6TLJ1_MYCCL|nr:NB-ARC-domain-containing protein [Mycena chlorophos]
MQHDPASLPPPVPPSLQTIHLRLGGGTGGAGGAAGQEGGTGGVGQGAQLTVHTQSATFNGQPLGYRPDDKVEVTTVDVHCPPPSQYFEGREDILEQLKHFFGNNSNKGQIVVLLHGLGGIGKTQTALKFIQSSLATKRSGFHLTA